MINHGRVIRVPAMSDYHILQMVRIDVDCDFGLRVPYLGHETVTSSRVVAGSIDDAVELVGQGGENVVGLKGQSYAGWQDVFKGSLVCGIVEGPEPDVETLELFEGEEVAAVILVFVDFGRRWSGVGKRGEQRVEIDGPDYCDVLERGCMDFEGFDCMAVVAVGAQRD